MPTTTNSYCVMAYARTDVGLIRENNEDVWAVLPELKTYLLADGMGGHAAGEIAAQKTVEILSALIAKAFEKKKKRSVKEIKRRIDQLIRQTNAAVHEKAQSDREFKGMGTTICCTHFHEEGLIYAHVGDSRIYRFHQNTLIQLTQDHSLVSELIELGELNAKQAKACDYKNIITRAIGTEALVEPTIQNCPLSIGDQILMCSDGLSDLLTHIEIENILTKAPSIEKAVGMLIDKAKDRGGHDNITAILLQVSQEALNAEKDLSG
jgi:serine/threonine protein phosphatase PrpC